jgi:hypothetical protein
VDYLAAATAQVVSLTPFKFVNLDGVFFVATPIPDEPEPKGTIDRQILACCTRFYWLGPYWLGPMVESGVMLGERVTVL